MIKSKKSTDEIAKSLNLGRTVTNYHLEVLRDIGIVEEEHVIEKEPESAGKISCYYKLNREKLREVTRFIREVIRRWDSKKL